MSKAFTAYAIPSPGEDFTAIGAASQDESGQPVQRFRKALIKDGHYQHPSKGWRLSVTAERRKNWATNFAKMNANGGRVGVPNGHSFDADENRGWVVGMENDGDTLYGVCEMIGDDAIKAAARNDCSVWIEKDYKDGKGVEYGESILHAALTPAPVVPGLGDFVKLSNSPDEKTAAVFCYDASTQQTNGDSDMDLKALATGLGIESELTDDNVIESIKGHFKIDEDAHASEIEALQGKVTAAESMAASLKEKGKGLSIDPDVLDETAANAQDRLDILVDTGKVPPTVGEALGLALIGGTGSRNAFALSRRLSGSSEQTSLTRRILDALSDLPVLTGESTGHQSLALSNDAASDANKEVAATAGRMGDALYPKSATG